MARTDWSLNGTVQPQDMNAIGEEINQLREDVDHIEIPSASVTEAGIVKLSNATNSTSETLAATPRAVNSAYDAATAAQTTANAANTAAATAQARADSAFQLGNERKAEVVAALVAKGISASTSESWDSLIAKLNSIVKATGNAVTADVLSGRTFSNAGANNLIGSMPNRGSGGTVTPGTTNQTKAAGYYSSAITILGDSDLDSNNIRSEVDIFGVLGALEPKLYYEYTVNRINPSVSSTLELPFTPKIAMITGTYKSNPLENSPTDLDYGICYLLSHTIYNNYLWQYTVPGNLYIGKENYNRDEPLNGLLLYRHVGNSSKTIYNVVVRAWG
ncbi:phage tail protein [Paenibacillus bouchesdurhonensis]|uniref:phage tail protein n=1 Tax=Paenibacillus bouchesdurhonensis TaxID=1870990 RepID=UPI000DA6271E|nr:phage tail protein [Paenibacillus bouchesdurhonensis]